MKYEKQMWLLQRKMKQADLDTTIRFFIAGGALTSVFSGKPINDLDAFFYEEADFDTMVKDIENKGFTPAFKTNNALSYNLLPHGETNSIRVQLIRKYFGTPNEIISKFDYTVCMAAYEPNHGVNWEWGTMTVDDRFLYHLSEKLLVFNHKTEYPIASLWRAKKYLKREFKLPAIECIKLALAINNLKIGSYEGLKDQLEGIDTFFLKDLTDAMLEKADEVYDFEQALEWMDRILSQKMGWSDE